MRDLRWPVQPLLDLPGVTTRDVCRVIHLSGQGWARALAEGLTDPQADRAAIRLGYHPEMVWPGWVEAGLDTIDRLFVQLELQLGGAAA